MKKLFLLLIVFLTFSCAKREVQLPETSLNDITKIQDVSPVYMFYDEENDSIEFNRKNVISTTNWLVNIDKRLTLKQILPHLQYLQEKRNKDGMHKNENARNYFTCFNPETKSLSFIDFTETILDDKLSEKDSLSSRASQFPENTKLEIYLSSSNKLAIYINSNEIVKFTSLKNFDHDMDSILNLNDLRKTLYFEYSQEISFQEYITLKSQISNYVNRNVEIADIEFIHN